MWGSAGVTWAPLNDMKREQVAATTRKSAPRQFYVVNVSLCVLQC